MAKKRSKKSCYKSIFSESWISSGQYIAELTAKNKSRSLKTDLPTSFWTLPEWKKYLKWQVVCANRLLLQFTAREIIAALNDKRAKRIWSLKTPWFTAILEEYKGKFADEPDWQPETEIIENPVIAKSVKNEKTLLGRLNNS